MTVDFFESSNALESLRSSDFDALSAYGEVIDNSLQANAKKIAIRFESVPERANYHRIQNLIFRDDGHGMSEDTLHSCLKLGWSSRFNDRSGIGRFGVGMILGAIHEAKRIEVYSRKINSPWRWTYIDLDEIGQRNLLSIPAPEIKEPPKELNLLPESESGTIVIWSKHDRQKKSAHLISEEAKHWIGRTFRYFIWDGIEISVNGELVKAHDPLYIRTKNTRFPDDPQAREYKAIPLPWKVPLLDRTNGGPDESNIEIRMSLLHKERRKYQGAGGSQDARDRKIDENEGVSILRNRREVFYGTLPHWSSVRWKNNKGRTWSFEERDRWWGCEILFSAEIDSDFTVKNIKRGAEPVAELKAKIKELITPTRSTAIEEVERVWKEARQQEQEKEAAKDAGLKREPHSKAEAVARNTVTPKSVLNSSIPVTDAAPKIIDQVMPDADEEQKSAYTDLFSSQPFTIQDGSWKGATFWEVFHAGGHTFLSYNKSHKFFEEIYRLMNGLEKGDIEPERVAKAVRDLVDLLLISAAKAQSLYDQTTSIHVGNFVEGYNQQWGHMLDGYVATWLREEENEI